MKKYFFLILFGATMQLSAQVDTQSSAVISFDTTWNHSIQESDLILKLYVTQTFYVTDGIDIQAKVLQVVKGNWKEKKIAWSMSTIEYSQERWTKRLDAIYPDDWKKPYTVYAGFYRTQNETSDIKNPITSEKYNFFMSTDKP